MGKVNDPHGILVGNIHPLLDMLCDRWGGLWFDVVISSGGRTDAEQKKLWAQGRTTPGDIVTNAMTASASPHGFRWVAGKRMFMAIDAYAMPLTKGDSPRLMAMADVAKKMGNITCGRDFVSRPGDFGHFEVTGWRLYPYAGDANGSNPPPPLAA